MLLLLYRAAYPSAGALIFNPPDPDPNTSVSGTWVPCDSARKWAGAGRENDCDAAD